MLAVRVGLAGAMERIDEDEPLLDVTVGLSASTGAMIALLDLAAGRSPIIALPCIVILLARWLRLSRLSTIAAMVVWLRVLSLSQGTGMLAPLLMLAICAALLVGPGRVIDWFEVQWEVAAERHRQRRDAELVARVTDEEPEALGWIEDLPDSGGLT
jgi:hypothetical protein